MWFFKKNDILIRGVVVLGAVLLLSSCTPSNPDLADPTMPGETGGSEEIQPYESTPAPPPPPPPPDVIEEMEDYVDLGPDFDTPMIDPIDSYSGLNQFFYLDELHAGTAQFQGQLLLDIYANNYSPGEALTSIGLMNFSSLESHCAFAQEFMWMTAFGPASMEEYDLNSFYSAQQTYLIWMAQTASEFTNPDVQSGWPQGVDPNMVFENIVAYLNYMVDMQVSISNTPQVGGHAAGAHIEGPASAVADALRDHLTSNCDLDLAAQADSWADEEYHQCERLAMQIIYAANNRITSWDPRTKEMPNDSFVGYFGSYEDAWEEHNHSPGILPHPTTENLNESLTLIKALYSSLRSGFIHVEPSGVTELDVCLTTGNWPPMFTLFLEST
jgi:hypothetical protein